MDMEESTFRTIDINTDRDLDFSFTSAASTATDRTFASSSPRSSLARSSLTLSFNESRLSSITTTSTAASVTSLPLLNIRPHRKSEPQWSAIKTATSLSSDGKLHLRHLKLLHHLGTGNLGRVFLCRLRDNDRANFALKVVDKDSLNSKKLSQVQMEAEILSMLDHPFLPTLYARLEVSHYTCLLIDYCPGGDLLSLLRRQPGNRLLVQAVRFFAGEVLVALEYLHSIGVVYRDLKPENVLLREDGHVMLSDFDLCFKADVVPTFQTRTLRSLKTHQGVSCFGSNRHEHEESVVSEFVAEPTTAFSKSCVGTHEYLAPELVSGSGHGNGVDWWAFGVFVYELLYGTTPFKGGSKEGTLRNIASTKAVKFPFGEGEEEVGMEEAKNLIDRLLVKDPRRRMGCSNGATEVKRHPFFDGIKWSLIRTYRPPENINGLMRRTKAPMKHVNHVSGVVPLPKRRRLIWNWKRLSGLFIRNKKNVCSSQYYLNQSNSNYYHYVSSNNNVRQSN